MIEVEWKPKLQKERVVVLMSPLPSNAVCEKIIEQPVFLKHVRNTLQTLCGLEEIPYIVVDVPNMNPLCFDEVERFERLYGVEVRLIPRLELLYTSMEYSATLSHECVYMLSNRNEWHTQSIPLEWFFDVFIQDYLYPFYEDTQYWLSKELKKYIKPYMGSGNIYEKCMISMKFMTSLETLVNQLMGVASNPLSLKHRKDHKNRKDTQTDAEDADADEDALMYQEMLEGILSSPQDEDKGADADADTTDDSKDDTTDDSKDDHDWIVVIGNMEDTNKTPLMSALQALQKKGHVKWIYSIEDLSEHFPEAPKHLLHRLPATPLTYVELQSLTAKFQRAICSFYLPVSLLWIGEFALEAPDSLPKMPKAFYSPEAWCSLNPEKIYGATHAKTEWILYEPVGCLYALAHPEKK